jgi:hypothetical protein
MAGKPRKSRPNEMPLHFSDATPHDVLKANRTKRRRAMIVGYARTSTWDQTAGLAAQQRELKAWGCEKIFAAQVYLFTHQQTDLPADDPRIVLTGVLAEATNLGLSRMADACSVASLRKLAWTAGWHLREDTYRSALAMLVNVQHSQPLATLFGAADISSSDGQGLPTAGRGEAVGAINAADAPFAQAA